MRSGLWDLKEEKITCQVFLEELDCSIETAEIARDRMVNAGFEEREITAIQGKLRDYDKIHYKKNISHCAPKSIKIYKELTRTKSNSFEGLHNFIIESRERNTLIRGTNFEFDLADDSSMPGFDFNYDPSVLKFVMRGTDIAKRFTDYLFDLLNKDGRKYSNIYNSVGMSRDKFSKILQGKSLSIENLIMLSVALKLDYQTASKFMSLAKVVLDPSDPRDATIIYALKHGIYDTTEIDEGLMSCGVATIFSEE